MKAGHPPSKQMPPEELPPAPEATLVRKSQQGDTGAFGELVALHQHKVFATLYNATRNEQDAWDLAQETFLKAWRNIGRFQGQSSFSTWLYRISTNVSIDWLRRRANRASQTGVELDDSVTPRQIAPGAVTAPREAPSPQSGVEGAEIGERIEEALSRLSPEHRAVITLRELDGLSYEEIADACGCSVGTVMSRLFYARKKLQTTLRDLYETL